MSMELLEARLAALEAAAGIAAPAEIDPFALPPSVAAGELIESAWGDAVVSTLTTHDAQIAVITPSSSIEGVAQAGRGRVCAQTLIVNTNAAGAYSVTFPLVFSSPPVVVPIVKETSRAIFCTTYSVSTTAFQGQLYNHDGTPLASGALIIDYVAIGYW